MILKCPFSGSPELVWVQETLELLCLTPALTWKVEDVWHAAQGPLRRRSPQLGVLWFCSQALSLSVNLATWRNNYRLETL